jgi:hypothetical protein
MTPRMMMPGTKRFQKLSPPSSARAGEARAR